MKSIVLRYKISMYWKKVDIKQTFRHIRVFCLINHNCLISNAKKLWKFDLIRWVERCSSRRFHLHEDVNKIWSQLSYFIFQPSESYTIFGQNEVSTIWTKRIIASEYIYIISLTTVWLCNDAKLISIESYGNTWDTTEF